jgi:hypothetical protein
MEAAAIQCDEWRVTCDEDERVGGKSEKEKRDRKSGKLRKWEIGKRRRRTADTSAVGAVG